MTRRKDYRMTPEEAYEHKLAAITYARWRGMADKADGNERMRWIDPELQAIYDKEYKP